MLWNILKLMDSVFVDRFGLLVQTKCGYRNFLSRGLKLQNSREAAAW